MSKNHFSLATSITVQGSLLEARRAATLTPLPLRSSKRGTISTFSSASRRRLIRLMARMDVSGIRATFLTLTFSKLPTPEEAKTVLKRFTMRMRRAHPKASALWRMEFQERGAIHFHMLWFGLAFIPQRDLQRTWEACTGEGRSIIDIRLLRNKRQAMSYVAKYLGKVSQAQSATSLDKGAYRHEAANQYVGRFWGVVNREALPFAEKFVALIKDEDLSSYLWWTIQALSHRRGSVSWRAAYLYGDELHAMLRFALDHAEFSISDLEAVKAEMIALDGCQPTTGELFSYAIR